MTPSRRAVLALAAAGGGAFALPRRLRAAAPPAHRIGFALVGIGKLTQKQLIPALRATKLARLTALVSGHADKAKQVAAAEGVPELNRRSKSGRGQIGRVRAGQPGRLGDAEQRRGGAGEGGVGGRRRARRAGGHAAGGADDERDRAII